MSPLEAVVAEANGALQERGFEPLDELNGRIGGERHGIWDWTWIATRRFAPPAYACLYAWRSAEDWTAEVWARIEDEHAERSLVRHLDRVSDPASLDDHQLLLGSLEAAAGRALRLVERRPPTRDETVVATELEKLETLSPAAFGLEPRLRYGATVELVHDVLASTPGRVWTNQEVLRELLTLGHGTDRADVNNALSDLTKTGRARRISWGHYSVGR
jgi:hypothetical protein